MEDRKLPQISHAQKAQTKELLLNNEWKRDEVVIDARAETGKVTNPIVIVKRGKINAVHMCKYDKNRQKKILAFIQHNLSNF
ncbi:MAG TPA: hypothetical protein VLE21_03425 [Candidatus Nitrosocosmicus sp.]|nr:hypothetical protein [Candidatus Nitrosocosmicus sp.]